MRFPRPTIASGTLCVLTAIYLLAFTNTSFWQRLIAYFSDHPQNWSLRRRLFFSSILPF